MTARLRRWYGAGPAHLLGMCLLFLVAGYAATRLLAGGATGVAVWFIGAAMLHDLLLVPLYTVADRLVRHAWWVNYVRVPAAVSLVLLLVWAPLVLHPPPSFEGVTGHSADVYLPRWLGVTAMLFTGSGLLLLTSGLRRRAR